MKAAAGCAAANIERYSTAAAGLLVAAAFWSVLHPPSYHLLRCIAAALPVYAGYAETARSCATNRIPEGAKVLLRLSLCNKSGSMFDEHCPYLLAWLLASPVALPLQHAAVHGEDKEA